MDSPAAGRPAPNAALAEIVWRGLRGRVVLQLRRLRQPRYLVAFLASVAYFSFLVLPSWWRGAHDAARHAASTGSSGFSPAAGEGLLIFSLVASLVVPLITTAIWIFASAKPALQLSEADIDLLLPAPIARRKVIELSLWRQQAGLLGGAILLNLVRGSGPLDARASRVFVTWAILSLASFHSKGVSLWKARLKELPAAAARRRAALAIAAFLAFWIAVLAALATAVTAPAAAAATLHEQVLHLAAAPPFALAVLLAPFRWLAYAAIASVVRFAGPAGGAGAPLPITGLPVGGWHTLALALFLAALVAANYEWVVRSRVHFEDATIERARRAATRRTRRPALPAATASARRSQPFRLAATGAPELAIYWKNLCLASRTPLRRRAGLALFPGLAAWAVLAVTGAPPAAVASVAGSGAGLLLLLPLMGALSQRQDLRSDLLQLELLRTWPVPGWRLVAAELLTPFTQICLWLLGAWSLLLGAMAAAAAAGPHLGRDNWLYGLVSTARWHAAAAPAGNVTATVLAASLGLLVAGAAIALLQVTVQNLAALALPGWVSLGPERRSGSMLGGQRLLMMLGSLVALAVGAIPGVLLVVAVVVAAGWLGVAPAAWHLPLLGLLLALPLLAESALLVRIGGALWERLDPAEEILAPAP